MKASASDAARPNSTKTYQGTSVSVPSSTSATPHSTFTSKTSTISTSKTAKTARGWRAPNLSKWSLTLATSCTRFARMRQPALRRRSKICPCSPCLDLWRGRVMLMVIYFSPKTTFCPMATCPTMPLLTILQPAERKVPLYRGTQSLRHRLDCSLKPW